MDHLALWLAVALAAGPGLFAECAQAAETEALANDTPWRVFLVCSYRERKKGERKDTAAYTPLPPANWTQAGFDDSGWGRYLAEDLWAYVGGYGYRQSSANRLLCLRARFGISDPAQSQNLTLALEYRGGVVVHVNGQEIARQHLPAGKLEPSTTAADYPAQTFTDPAGDLLGMADRPAAEHPERYEQRIRKLAVTVPAAALRPGGNTLAVELYAAPIGPMQLGKVHEWSPVGLCGARLSGTSGGVRAYADAAQGITIWSATPMDAVCATPGKRGDGFNWATPAGLMRGNPFEPLQPIRTVAPRGGTCSGQVVVSGSGPLVGLKASLGPLKHARGDAALPAEAVRVRYARQDKDETFCNALLPQPAAGAPVQPVWVVVEVPRNQAPGWYTGTLTLTLGAQTTPVPVQVLVAGWTLTDPRDNATFVSLYQSPDTLAEYYQVEPWSERHFALIERSLNEMAPLGNDVLFVPVILGNGLTHKTGLVRWVRKGDGYTPEFSAFERYLDLHTRAFGRPKVVTLSIWKHDFGCRSWFRGMQSETVKPCMVTELNPASGKMTPLQAPHFGEAGSEEFWKTMIEGVRRILKARGFDDRFLLLGEVFDSRPLEPVVKFFQKIEPGMRWQLYAHLDSGDSTPVKDGKLIVKGGFELGLRIRPNEGALPEFRREYPNVPAHEFYLAQAQRCSILHNSSPLSYRVVLRDSGTIARIGLDFWPMGDERGRRRSFYVCPPGEGWLWRGHVPALTAPGPEGAVRTTRGQMLLEGLQETEALVALLRARQKAAPELAARIEQCRAVRERAGLVGRNLSQAMLGLDLIGMAAREYALAAELAGETSEGDWAHPPAASAEGGGK